MLLLCSVALVQPLDPVKYGCFWNYASTTWQHLRMEFHDFYRITAISIEVKHLSICVQCIMKMTVWHRDRLSTLPLILKLWSCDKTAYCCVSFIFLYGTVPCLSYDSPVFFSKFYLNTTDFTISSFSEAELFTNFSRKLTLDKCFFLCLPHAVLIRIL